MSTAFRIRSFLFFARLSMHEGPFINLGIKLDCFFSLFLSIAHLLSLALSFSRSPSGDLWVENIAWNGRRNMRVQTRKNPGKPIYLKRSQVNFEDFYCELRLNNLNNSPDSYKNCAGSEQTSDIFMFIYFTYQ